MLTYDGLSSVHNTEISWSRSLRFWLLLLFDIPAVVCSLFLLYHLLTDRSLRQSLANHSIIALLISAFICQIIDIPLYLDFIQRGTVWTQKPIICLIWWLVDLGFYNFNSVLVAWTSIERHILIFHDQWLSTFKRRLLIHYLPMTVLVLYLIIYYILMIFFPPCQHVFVYSLPVCSSYPCHLSHPIFGLWDIMVHGCLSTLLIVIFNIALIFRVLMQKRHVGQTVQWHRYWRMSIPLLSISALYLIFNFPIMAMVLAHHYGWPADSGVEAQLIAFFLAYWVIFLLPFICLYSLPKLQYKLCMIIGIGHQVHIGRRV
ncbi:unnamed protein product [Rotaria sp. Silwood1]|nr:unnamed protein product [Rotaria sp. Silwood1]CAF1536763.1 unnamed protein product [Rotaria sp. Silwood1]CAF3656806.1 unnamed protein product [Rotaria sp. Silwood1]CAF4568163.1 unnamed protein product [Rotaria sp. Silwood1]